MKHLLPILFLACVCVGSFAQTPFDSFAPEVSKPMLELREPESSPDTLFCTVVADIQHQMLLLVDVSSREVIATAPITDDLRKWLSVDPLADKYPGISPYAYCAWNPVKYIDPDGRELISSFNLKPNTRDYSRNSHINKYAKTYYDNNSPIIHFFAHGASNRVRLEDGTAINTPQKMFNYLYEQSQEFKASCSTGKPSVLVLHSCSTGSGENSFAQQLSADELFSNTLVIAPSSVLEVGSKETISNAGSWIAFYNGNQVGTINAHDTPWYKFWGEKKEAVQLKDLLKNMTPEQIFKFFNVDIDK